MIGWPIEEVLPRLGRPRCTTHLGDSVHYEFDDLFVMSHGGAVAFVAARQPAGSKR